MKSINYFTNCDNRLLKIIRKLSRFADEQELCVYLVGGPVRDLILKRENKDLDIVVEGDAVAVARSLSRSWGGSVKVFAQFRTAEVILSDRTRIDLATARKEKYPHPGSLPIIYPGALKDDHFRRDFTVNAMALGLNRRNFGQLIDEYGGIRDLREKKIRILHSLSFIDDPTRILRAIRFEKRLNFRIERSTLQLLKKALADNVIRHVKPPRFFAEFKKILQEKYSIVCIQRLYKLGVLEFLDVDFPIDFRSMRLLEQNISSVRVFPGSKSQDVWFFYFLSMISKFDEHQRNVLIQKFPFKREEKRAILETLSYRRLLKKLAQRGLSFSRVYKMLRDLSASTVCFLRMQAVNETAQIQLDQYVNNTLQIKAGITGEDLKKIGIMSGKQIGGILEEVLCAKIDGRVRTKIEELKLVKDIYHVKNGKS